MQVRVTHVFDEVLGLLASAGRGEQAHEDDHREAHRHAEDRPAEIGWMPNHRSTGEVTPKMPRSQTWFITM